MIQKSEQKPDCFEKINRETQSYFDPTDSVFA
jgi:hypothetical protein